jgi:hypothetical protein
MHRNLMHFERVPCNLATTYFMYEVKYPTAPTNEGTTTIWRVSWSDIVPTLSGLYFGARITLNPTGVVGFLNNNSRVVPMAMSPNIPNTKLGISSS